MHVHVQCGQGEAKYWLEPEVELAENYGPGGRISGQPEISLMNMKTKSESRGSNTSAVEVSHISQNGFWLLLDNKELFLPFEQFPWFRDASVSAINNVTLPTPHHLYWPDLDLDLSVESIEHPERFPLIAKPIK